MPDLKVKFIPILMKRGPKFPLEDQREFLSQAEAFLKGEAKETLKRELKTFTRGWSTKVNFAGRATIKLDELSLLIFPRGKPGRDIWIWVSDGTKPRTIRAKHAPSLRFRSGYAPLTRPGGFRGGRGTALGKFVTPMSVKYPGIKARNFETEVKNKKEQGIQRKMRTIFKRAYKL